MSGDLKSRLERARELTRTKSRVPGGTELDSAKRETPPQLPGTPSPPGIPGWTRLGPYLLYRRVYRSNPLPRHMDMRPYVRTEARPAVLIKPGSESGTDRSGNHLSFPADRLLFFDLETTGLSGGAGTIAFLAGFGSVLPSQGSGEFEIRQYLLTDFPGESDFLEAVLGELRRAAILATYNGRTFDIPLLRTRLVLNRKAWPDLKHADFLPAARRLWSGRFKDCSLGTLERDLLGRERILDIPGARIPEIWLEFAGQGFHELMPAVLEHNAEDLATLAALAARCAEIHADPEEARGCDRSALGAFWLRLDPEVGRIVLERAFIEGDERAGWILIRHYRRRGILEEYRRILAALSPSWESWVERAKDEEHRRKNLGTALAAARAAEPFVVNEALRHALERRIRRLERRVSSRLPLEGRTDRRR